MTLDDRLDAQATFWRVVCAGMQVKEWGAACRPFWRAVTGSDFAPFES